MEQELLERFSRFIDSRIEPDPNSGCWLWSGTLMSTGYGVIGVRKNNKLKNYSAHRASWTIHRGPIPAGMVVCHRCDTPACVNPSHLFLGTQRDNLRDMFAKGRHDRHGQKLTPEQVRAIRRDGRSCEKVARDHGVCGTTVWRVRTRKGYAKVA